MKKPFFTLLEEDEFDYDKSVTILGDCDGKDHNIEAYLNENNDLVLCVNHEVYEEWGCECGCGDFEQFTTMLQIPLDELV